MAKKKTKSTSKTKKKLYFVDTYHTVDSLEDILDPKETEIIGNIYENLELLK